jgi:hypothetical protein
MSHAARAGLTPKSISIDPPGDGSVCDSLKKLPLPSDHAMAGLTTAIGLIALKPTLFPVESLKLAFIDDIWVRSSSAEEA